MSLDADWKYVDDDGGRAKFLVINFFDCVDILTGRESLNQFIRYLYASDFEGDVQARNEWLSPRLKEKGILRMQRESFFALDSLDVWLDFPMFVSEKYLPILHYVCDTFNYLTEIVPVYEICNMNDFELDGLLVTLEERVS